MRIGYLLWPHSKVEPELRDELKEQKKQAAQDGKEIVKRKLRQAKTRSEQ